MSNKQRILIVPLDWGLGHATRCIPIIRQEMEKGNTVLLAGNGRSKEILKRTFPHLQFVADPPDYAVTYPKTGSFSWHLFKQVPKILEAIQKEGEWVREICTEHKIDKVISDNRYGLSAARCHTVIITHQTSPRVPWFLKLNSDYFFRKWNERFDECWIPDLKPIERSFGGVLSHDNIPANAEYIGPLSRFTFLKCDAKSDYNVVILISGPEPQRSIFQQEMKNRFEGKPDAVLMLCGTPETRSDKTEGNIRTVSHMDDDALVPYLKGAKLVIARSGYSSIMDFAALELKNVEYHATPGQTEQEYLKKWLEKS